MTIQIIFLNLKIIIKGLNVYITLGMDQRAYYKQFTMLTCGWNEIGNTWTGQRPGRDAYANIGRGRGL